MSAPHMFRLATRRNVGRIAYAAQRLPFSSSARKPDQIPFKVSAQGTGVAQTVNVDGTSHVISTDAYPAFGGADKFPSPLHFNLTALSSCSQVTGSIVAADHGIQLSHWEVSVEGKLDPSVLVQGAQDNGNGGNWNSIHLRVAVKADGVAKNKFDHWASEVERRCPVTQLFKKSGAQWSSEWTQL